MTLRATSDRPGLPWSIASLALATCGSLVLAIAPIYDSGHEHSVTVGTHQTSHSSINHETLLEHGQTGAVIGLLLAPIAITAIPLLLQARPHVNTWRAIALTLLVLILPIGYFTIGGFYLPSAITMLVAILRDRPDGRADSIAHPAT